MISSNRTFPRSHHFQISQSWKPQLHLFRINMYIMLSARMGLKQAWSLDLLRDAIHLKKILDLPNQINTGVVLLYVTNKQTEQESPDEEYGKRGMGNWQDSIKKSPLPTRTPTPCAWQWDLLALSEMFTPWSVQYLYLHRRLIKLGRLYFHLGACCFVLCQCNYLHHFSHASLQSIFASCNCDSRYLTRSCPQSCCAKHVLTFFRSFQAGHNESEGVTRKIISHNDGHLDMALLPISASLSKSKARS